MQDTKCMFWQVCKIGIFEKCWKDGLRSSTHIEQIWSKNASEGLSSGHTHVLFFPPFLFVCLVDLCFVYNVRCFVPDFLLKKKNNNLGVGHPRRVLWIPFIRKTFCSTSLLTSCVLTAMVMNLCRHFRAGQPEHKQEWSKRVKTWTQYELGTKSTGLKN